MDISKLVKTLGFSTQTELAKALGYASSATVSHWGDKERGVPGAKGPGQGVKRDIEQLAKLRGVDPDSLGLDE